MGEEGRAERERGNEEGGKRGGKGGGKKEVFLIINDFTMNDCIAI